MRFEWDSKKDAANLRKHGIAFEDAIEIFGSPFLEGPDDRQSGGEDRWLVLGEVRGRVIVVVYTWRGERRRIISARKAKKAEREAYYREIYSQ